MTGETTIAYQHEPVDDYRGTPTMSEYLFPGLNPSVEDLTLQNALTRMNAPDDPETLESVAQRFEGALGLSFTVTNAWWLNHVYGAPPTAGGESSAPYTYTWAPRTGRAQSSRWYIGVNHLDGTSERVIKGGVFPQMELQFSEGDEVRASLTGFYGDEEGKTSISAGSLTGKNLSPVMFHGASLEIPNSQTIMKPQEATLELQTGARAQRTWQRKPIDAVLGRMEPSLSLSKIITGTSQRTLAYGNSTAPADSVDGAATATLRAESGGQNALEAELTRVTPNSYNWQQLADLNEDSLEDIQYNVDGLTMVAESGEANAL